MKTVKVLMEQCYGIERLNYEFDFSNSNVVAIYARNGIMKTSFAKTFSKLQENKANEIRDEIFGIDGKVTVDCDGTAISPKNIYVIKSFESSYEADITPLLINANVKEHLTSVLKARDKLFKSLEKYSGLKIKKLIGGKTIYELEPQIISDFGFTEDSFLVNVLSLQDKHAEQNFSNISYNDLFDASVLKKIQTADFQEKIQEFIQRSEEIYTSYGFLKKGQFTLPKLKDIRKALEKDRYFVNGNKILLSGTEQIPDIQSLSVKITEIDEQIKAVPQFQAIEQLLSDVKGTVLKDIIEVNPELITWLSNARLHALRKNLWLSYFQCNSDLFDDLCGKYKELSQEIENVALDDTPWKQALNIYKKRFDVPYNMKITNLKSSIIGESIPHVEFSFERSGQSVTLSRNKLDELDTLSQGEKRALYLLNVIFEIEEIKQSGHETLFIIDDIADSFDYKNKYAIVEYLYELAEDTNFSMIILSHNFDFFRTISSRLGLKRENRLYAENTNGEILLEQEYYQGKPFIKWKENPIKKNILALIPFVRNIVEYGHDYNVNGTLTDYDLLSTLLHEKEHTHDICFSDLLKIYKFYLGIEKFDDTVFLCDKVVDSLYLACDSLTAVDKKLENKVILAMAIRHKAEEFMKSSVQSYTGTMSWKGCHKTYETGTSTQYLEMVSSGNKQTRELINGYKQFGEPEKCKILEEVSIMTPENIHLNSFMYEPIIDMDIVELLSLYHDVKTLKE